MKKLQVILTIDLDNDAYSQLLNKSLSIETLVAYSLENDENNISFNFPAIIIPALEND